MKMESSQQELEGTKALHQEQLQQCQRLDSELSDIKSKLTSSTTRVIYSNSLDVFMAVNNFWHL